MAKALRSGWERNKGPVTSTGCYIGEKSRETISRMGGWFFCLLLKPNRKNWDSVSRVRENRLHGLMRGRAALAGYRFRCLLYPTYWRAVSAGVRWHRLPRFPYVKRHRVGFMPCGRLTANLLNQDRNPHVS